MYGAVPPFAVKVMVPLLPPLQLTLLAVVEALSTDTGWVIIAEAIAEQPLISATVTL